MNFWVETKPIRVVLNLASVFASFVYVLSKIPRDRCLQRNSMVFFALAIFSLYATGKSFISFVLEDFCLYPDVLQKSEHVSKDFRASIEPAHALWWFSQHFCFLLPFTSFINVKSRVIGMHTLELCAYTWLGLGGPVSLSLLLFLVRYNLAMQDKAKTVSSWRLPTWGTDVLGVCLWLSFWCLVSLMIESKDVKHYASAIYFVLFLPSLVPANSIKSKTEHTMLFPVFFGTLVLVTGQHWYQIFKVLPELKFKYLSSLIHTGFAHHSQASISFDLMFCFLALACHILFEFNFQISGLPVLVVFIFLTPLLSLGSTFALLMIYDGYVLSKQLASSSKID